MFLIKEELEVNQDLITVFKNYIHINEEAES